MLLTKNAQYLPYMSLSAALKENKNKARCTVCCRDFDVSSMGEAAVRSHMAGAKHAQNMARHESDSRVLVTDFFKKSSSTKEDSHSHPHCTQVGVDFMSSHNLHLGALA